MWVPMGKKIAWLIFDGVNAGAKRHKNSSFLGLGNAGAIIVGRDIKAQTGIEVEYCVAETANKYDIVLVSLTSNYDIIAFARSVYKIPFWRKQYRRFMVVAGGFGMQNPIHILEWLDFAYFGRAEGEFGHIINRNFEYDSDSLMRIRDVGLHPVMFRQVSEMLEIEEMNIGGKKFHLKEEMHGCPNKCTYCHYTYARKHEGRKDFVMEFSTGKSIELEWMDPCLYPGDKPDIITALDGISERSRYLHNRRLSNETVRDFFVEVLKRTKCNGIDVNLYNIIGMEGATPYDWEYFIQMIADINRIDFLGKKMRIKITNTPFRPSPITPQAYAPVNLDYKGEFSETALEVIYDTEKSVKWNKGRQVKFFQRSPLESEASLLSDICVIRAGAKNSDKIFNLFAFNTKFRALLRGDQYKYLIDNYDLSDMCREYDVSESLPTWFLESYIPNDVIKKIRTKTKDNAAKMWDTTTKRFIDIDSRAPDSLDNIELPGRVIYSGEQYIDDFVNKTGK